MAGSDRSRRVPGSADTAPAIILVEPQLGENIGMVARAMLNCALTDLRLVRPRDGWPNEKAAASSSGALEVIEGAQLFDDTEAAIADLNRVYAATARPRDMTKRVLIPEAAADEMRAAVAAGERVGVLFGPEASGLGNDHVALADTVLTVPLNPGFSSLNLAQAVFVVGYSWFRSRDETPARILAMPKDARPATKKELLGLFEHLERELDEKRFLRVEEKRPTMVRNIRNLFQRAHPTDQEVRTLRGIITSLTGKWIRAGSKQDKSDE